MQERIKYILQEGKSKNAKESDIQKMFALFHQADNEYELKSNLLEELNNSKVPDTLSSDFTRIFEKLWAVIEKNKTKSKSKIKYLSIFSKVAAAVIIGFFIGFYMISKNTYQEPASYAFHSPNGSVSDMVLPDGSIIFLNSGSTLKYSIDGKKDIREVSLNGEAWFDVAKNKEKPFIVHTSSYDVNVTGTKFNVKAYNSDNKIITTLEEGKVIIQSTESCRLTENITLKAGEQVVLDKDSRELTIKTVKTKWFTSWKDNKLIFVNMNMDEFIVILERKYGVDIEIENKAILDLHVDCTIKNESIIEILEVIKKTLPVNYKIVGQKIVISINKTKKGRRNKK